MKNAVKKNIAIFLHHPMCSIESVNGVIRALSPAYNMRVFTKHKVPDGFFDDIDMVVFPGGHGDAGSFDHLLRANIHEVKKFLKRGGTDAQARPTQCFGRGVWISTDPTALGQGAVDANAPVTLPIALTFTSGGATVDCEKVSCGVYVRRDHMNPTDFTLDRYQAVSFVPLVQPAIVAKAVKGKVLFTVTGYNGKTLTVTVGKKTVSKVVTSDSFKFYVGGTGNKSTKVTVSLDGTELLNQSVKIKAKK